jgi:outer membrane protein
MPGKRMRRCATPRLVALPARSFGCVAVVLALLVSGGGAHAQQNQAPAASSGESGTPTIDLKNAIERAKSVSQQLQSAQLSSLLAREDRLQAKAGLLPTLGYNNQFIYTQGNGTSSGVFVANDGVHIYSSQGAVHEELISFTRIAEYRRSVLAQTIAEAKAEVVARGLVAAVVQSYYAVVLAQRRAANARQSLEEVQRFAEITEKLERGGEVARADLVKARIVLQQRQRDFQDSQLAIEKARISLGTLIFQELRLDFIIVDDLQTQVPLGTLEEFRAAAGERNPELRAAQLTVQHETLGISAAKAEYLPSLNLDVWYGINASQFSTWSGDIRNLGYSGQASLVIPVWNWGATKSKVRQAEFRQRQAQLDLSLTQKQLLSELSSLHAESRAALAQLDSLRSSLELASESLRLTLLRYQAGEVSILEVVDAQATVTQARNALDDGLSRHRVTLANLQVLAGTL